MALFGGLLGGGGSDPMDIYGDLFTEKQRAALRDQQMTQGLLNAAAVFSKAGQASRLPVSIPWGEAAQALGGSGDEAMNRMLKGMQVAEEVRGSRQTREWQTKLNQMLMPIWQKQMAMGQPLSPSPASVGAPDPRRGGTPPPPPAYQNPDMGDVAARPMAAPTATDAGDPLPGRGAGLLGPSQQADPLAQYAGLLGGGAAPGMPPFGQGSQGSPDRPIRIEQLSGEAAPAGEDARLSRLMQVETFPKPATAAHINYGGTGALGNPAEAGWRNSNIVPVPAPGGARFDVHREAAPDFAGFLQDLSALGYKIDPKNSSSYNYRNIRGSDQLSEHAYGTAIDINSNANLYTRDGKKVTNLPPGVGELAAKHNLEWGGNWKDPVDTMHFQWRGPAAATGSPAPADDSLSRLSQLMPVQTASQPGDPRGMTPVIRAAAQRYGVDPNVALRVAGSEGLERFSGDRGKSGTAFQLYTGGGLGNEFQQQTGLDPLDPKNEPAAIDWAMKNVSRTGWSPYRGAAGAGIGPRAGLPGGDNIRIEQLGSDAVPAGGAPAAGGASSGLIPGINMTPEALGTLNALMKVNKLGSPFDSLLETYYKSPGYLAEKARTEAQATKNVALEMDPLIQTQTDIAKAKVELEWKPKIEEAVQKLQSPILKEREEAKADIARYSKELEQNRQAAFTQTDATVFGPGGVVGTQKMTALEFAQRQQARAERVARGDTSLQPGDIVAAPIGAAPAGHQYIMTPQGTLSALPVPGTPEAQKVADAAEKKAEAQYQALQHRDIVVGNADRIEGMIAGAILPTTGAAGSWLSNLGGTAANNIRGAVDTLKARLSIDEINRIRNSNPTGAAFGNLTEKEGERVASAAANLDQSQTQDEFLYNLRVAKQIYLDATTRAKLSDEAVLKVPRSTTAVPPTIGGPPGGTAPRERRWNPKTGRLE